MAAAIALAMTACGDLDSAIQHFIASPNEQGMPLDAEAIAELEEAVEVGLNEAMNAEGVDAPGEGQGDAVDHSAIEGEEPREEAPQPEPSEEEPEFEGLNEDRNGNGILDPSEDIDGDGKLDFGEEDLDGDGHFDNIPEDENENGHLDEGEDIDGDGRLDPGTEDLDGDGHFDNVNEDINGNGELDPSEDIDGDGELDVPATPADEEERPDHENHTEEPHEPIELDEGATPTDDDFFGDDGDSSHEGGEFHDPTRDVEPQFPEGHGTPSEEDFEEGFEEGEDHEGEHHHDSASEGEEEGEEEAESGCSTSA